MATPTKEWSKLEVRAVVLFLFSKGTKPSEIRKQIAETYGEGALSRSRVYQWCTRFGEGRTSLGDESKSGRPKTSTNEENITRVDELIRYLAPSDFHLFGPLKRHLGDMALETEDDLISELRNWFDNLDIDFFRVGINSLLSRWQKCIDLHGDYVEK
ncbi:histone-lysine N-methyltransferase SETMAR [Plakobranchus ocellatus]|uniref:Histone-lysine N-methyltransferase SETMAR n=1 Tax=Plakobranchus ocellatus TaxID=259542 RepID=A0AAV3Z7G1_9GAST|nr:histone-lysine N-methyltransferase SETMAR [Plakobranchus ocellatus]